MFSLQSFSFAYPDTSALALDDVSIEINPGEFILLLGPSGSGKSTLLGALSGVVPHFSGGLVSGSATYNNASLMDKNNTTFFNDISIVFQNPETSVVMQTVEQELVFNLENLEFSQEQMLRRLAEVSGILDLGALLGRRVWELSYGELQKVVIGASLVTMPKVLLLDEPTSNLSPKGTSEIFGVLDRLNKEHGLTIVMCEQRLEETFRLVDRVVCLNKGRVKADCSIYEYIDWAVSNYPEGVPTISRVVKSIWGKNVRTVKEGRDVVSGSFYDLTNNKRTKSVNERHLEPVVGTKSLFFSYNEKSPLVLDNINIFIEKGSVTSVLGENGAGKSTLLRLLSGSLSPTKGEVRVGVDESAAIEVSLLSQDIDSYLLHNTVLEEVQFSIDNKKYKVFNDANEVLELTGLQELKDRHPRSLSVGQRQMVALACVLATGAKLLLLDEPSRGLDWEDKKMLIGCMDNLVRNFETSVVLATQDMDFAAESSDRAILLFKGQVLAEGKVSEVLKDSIFYTTSCQRLFKGVADGIVTEKDAYLVCASTEIRKMGRG